MDLIALLITPVLWLADRVLGWSFVRVRVHEAYFVRLGPESPWHYFINVVNLSPRREIEITHIWFDTDPQVPVLKGLYPPPRLRPNATFETDVPVAAVPDVPKNVKRLGRVRLSSGKIVKSKPGKPPSVGYTGGSGSR